MVSLGLWNRQIPAPSLFRLKQEPPKKAPVITPDPQIVEKMMNDDGKLISNKPDKQKGEGEEKPKKKKKRLPGEKMLKKLVGHKDDDIEEKKLKRILYAIKKATQNEY